MRRWCRAVAATWANTVARTLGVGAPAWSRAVVLSVVVIAYLPAVVAVGVPVLLERFVSTADTPIAIERVQALATDPSFVPQYWQYFEITAAVVVLFTALVGPAAATADRTDGMVPVYVRSPLGIGGYVFAKWAATASALLAVTAGPLGLLLVGNVVVGESERADPALAWRIPVAGAAVAGVHAAISVAVGLLARSRDQAAIAVTLVIIGLSSLASVVRADGGPVAAGLADPHRLVLDMGAGLVGADPSSGQFGIAAAAGAAGVWTIAWLALAAAQSKNLATRP